MNIRTFVAFLSENLQYNFPKTRGGGSKAIWNFSEKTSVLVFTFVPNLGYPSGSAQHTRSIVTNFPKNTSESVGYQGRYRAARAAKN